MILAIDPGDMTGVAWWKDNGDFLGQTQITLEELPEFWERLQEEEEEYVKTVIVEDFILFAQRARQQTGSRMKASQGIGMAKALAGVYGAEVVMQKADIKQVALKWTQIKLPSDHSKTHEWDAFLHGEYYLISNGVHKTYLEKQREKNVQQD